ncbi:MAG: minichromosome maintenance protein MCM [Candidatus Diapherotrites archaeon]|nr:minichromosome maintenance protein MCM [Candidatus Diapherotrites archaeon]
MKRKNKNHSNNFDQEENEKDIYIEQSPQNNPEQQNQENQEQNNDELTHVNNTENQEQTKIDKLDFETNPLVRRFESFLKEKMMNELNELACVFPAQKSLLIDYKKMDYYDVVLGDELIYNPDTCIEAVKKAIKRIPLSVLPEQEKKFDPNIRFYNFYNFDEVKLKELNSEKINKIVVIDGLVKLTSDVLPRIKEIAWECRRCGNIIKTIQRDTTPNPPYACACENKTFKILTESSSFVDFQRLEIQEPLEQLRGSEQPTNVEVWLTDDLVNSVLPGDRIKIVGIVRLKNQTKSKIVYGKYIEAIHIERIEKEFEELDITEEEKNKIEELAKDPEIYEKIKKSIAPNIYGHDVVKEAIALQLFGGVKKKLPNKSWVRGNIHILLVGEPGMAKSMLLQATSKIAPKAVYVAGKTTTGAGLSATAVKDEFGEGWVLKAGALILANGGFCMVDELDKMDDQDRSALHEAMEQGIISVAKAGIVTRFKADTSILAAANPKYSRFDPFENYIEQIDLPPSLLSRFDLFFIIKDVLDRKKDEEIATYITNVHRAGSKLLRKEKGEEPQEELTHVNNTENQEQTTNQNNQEKESIDETIKNITPEIDQELLRKYIAYARQNIIPEMTEEAKKMIIDFYVNLREQGRNENTYTATHRQLEALIRLSEASAKIRLSKKVEIQDAERAIRIFKLSMGEVAVDKTTGKIDIDILSAGKSRSEIENIKQVLRIIKEKSALFDLVSIDDVIQEAKNVGIDEEKVRDILTKLKNEGEIYFPKHGFVRITSG